MLGLKRFVRPDVVFSAIGHVGVLLLSLVVFGAGEDQFVPPEAMTVEIVPPSEAPPFEAPETETPPHVDGTPLESKSTGSEVSSNFEKGSASAAPPKPKMALPSPELTQARSNLQRSASLATEPPAPSPAEPQPETQPQATEPLLRPAIQADQSEPHPEEARTRETWSGTKTGGPAVGGPVEFSIRRTAPAQETAGSRPSGNRRQSYSSWAPATARGRTLTYTSIERGCFRLSSGCPRRS